MNTSSSRIRGFSLIELLVVMLIIGIVAAFVVPAASTILRGSQMTQASTIVFDQFNLARQYALSRNHPVEVRLIRYADPEVPGEVVNGVSTPTSGQYRAIQILDSVDFTDSSGNLKTMRVALDKPQLLPQAVIMNADASGSFSPLISGANASAQAGTSPIFKDHTKLTTNDPTMPRGIMLNYDYVSFRFLPDGSTDLPAGGTWFLTLQNLTDHPVGATPPANFYTIQVDPVSGTLKQFRPGI